MDELGFVEAVDGLSQGVVVAVSDGSDRGLDSGGDQRIGVGQRDVVAAPIAVMDQPSPRRFCRGGLEGLLESLQWQCLSAEAGGHCPADDPSRENVCDERGVAEPGRDPDVGDVSDPELIRSGSREVPLDQIRTTVQATSRARREHLSTTAYPAQTSSFHQPSGLVAADFPSGTAHRVMHLPIPVDAVVLGMNPTDLFDEHLVTDRSGRCRALLRGTVAARGEEPTFRRAQDAADGLDPEVIAMPIDEGDHFVVGWSSSLAKNTEAALRISLARRDSASSRRSLRFSSSRDSAGPAEGSAGP